MERKFQAFFPDGKLICGRDSLLGVETVTFKWLHFSYKIVTSYQEEYKPGLFAFRGVSSWF